MKIGKATRYAAPLALGVVVAALAVAARMVVPASAEVLEQPVPAPEFTHAEPREWINSGPLRVSDLRGRVVLVDFWTFDCWNCYRSFPWLKSLEARYEQHAFTVVGVHSPEFDHERARENVVEKVREFDLRHPVMIDNDFSYWKAMRNRYWPTFYLIDKQGRVRARFIGETHEGDRRARAVETAIERLLEEPS